MTRRLPNSCIALPAVRVVLVPSQSTLTTPFAGISPIKVSKVMALRSTSREAD